MHMQPSSGDFFSSDPKALLESGQTSWNISWCACAPNTTFSNNAKADVFNYRERLKTQPTDPALQYGLALALSKTNEHDQALALMQDA